MTAMNRYQIRVAATEPDRQEVYALRYRCYVEEMGKTDPPGVDHDRKLIHQPHDDDSRHYLVSDPDAKICAAFTETPLDKTAGPDWWRPVLGLDHLAELDPATITVGSGLVLRPDVRRSLVMALLVKHAFQAQVEAGRLYALMFCTPSLVALYEQLGFRRYTDGFNLSRGGTYLIPMILLMTDQEHLRLVGSPFYRLAEKRRLEPPRREVLTRLFPRLGRTVIARAVDEDELWAGISQKMFSATGPSVFDGLSQDEVRSLVRQAAVLDVKAGDRITRQGRLDTELFVALEGLFETELTSGDRVISLGVLGPGEVFGESGFFGLPRRADVAALTDGQVLVLSDALLDKMQRGHTPAYARFMKNLFGVLSDRLTEANKRLLGSID
jgi:CRP-like cAMP-binding protein